jgi:glycosyltransferase involved in cell wall biosynthesis
MRFRPRPTYAIRQKHVLMVTSALACGGTERQMLVAAQELMRRGYCVEVFELAGVHAGQFSFEPEFARLGIQSRRAADLADVETRAVDFPNVHGLQQFLPLLDHFNIARLGLALEKAIREVRPEIVHCWSDISNVIGGYVAAALGVPRIVLGHRNAPALRMDPSTAAYYRKAYRALLRNPRVVQIGNSVRNAREFCVWIDAGANTVSIVANGFLPSTIGVSDGLDAAARRTNLGVPDGSLVVGAIMRFAAEKAPELWLRTAAAIAAAREDVHFVLAGYGDLSDSVRRQILELGLTHRVTLLGPLREVGTLLRVLDVFLMTSRFEGVPNTLIEAQAAGVPVVAPIVGGVAETVRQDVTARLVAEQSADALAAAVLQILTDADWRRCAAAAGTKFVVERFDATRMIDATLALYHPSPLTYLRQALARLAFEWPIAGDRLWRQTVLTRHRLKNRIRRSRHHAKRRLTLL